jgi:hypothetical protein
MKSFFVIIFLLNTTTVFGQSGVPIDLDSLEINGTIKRETIENKLESRRRKLEEQTMKKLFKQMEVERIRNELRLSQKIEKAMQNSISDSEIE